MVRETTTKGPDKRARRRAERMAGIVDAALAIVVEEGFAALTMQRLADELGLAIGAFYRYFRGKDELLLAVQRRVLERVARDVNEAAERAQAAHAGGDVVERALVPLLAAVRAYHTLPERRPAQFRLLARWLGDPDPLVASEAAAPVVGAWMELFGLVPRLLAQAAAAGAIGAGDPLRRTLALWSALQGTHALRKLGRFEIPALEAEPLAEELIGSLLVGWGADRAAFEAAWTMAKALDERGGE